jgi:hypothetical protein
MSTRIGKFGNESKAIDFDNLPDEAKRELSNFYEYLVYKYGEKKKKADSNDVITSIEELSWEMGEKLYKSRDELYER